MHERKGNQRACHAICRYTQLIIHVEGSLLSSKHVKYIPSFSYIQYIIYYYCTLSNIYDSVSKKTL
jgi:hypothetical protein